MAEQKLGNTWLCRFQRLNLVKWFMKKKSSPQSNTVVKRKKKTKIIVPIIVRGNSMTNFKDFLFDETVGR